MHTLVMDTRYALRTLIKNPSFTMFAVAAMALGIGAGTAVFSIVDAVLLRPLPYPQAERLMTLWETEPEVHWAPVTMQDFLAWKKQNSVFSTMSAYEMAAVTLNGIKDPQRVAAARVSPELFRMLGISALRGRGLEPRDDNPNSAPVAVISERLWRTRFGTDPDLAGKPIRLSKKVYTIAGIMPAAFQSPRKEIDIWIPLITQAELAKPASHYLRVIARLKEGVSLTAARAEMDVIARRLAMQFPESNTGVGVRILPLLDVLHEEIGPVLRILCGSVALLLLIACVNLSGLLLARTANRRQEVSLRLAMGASRLQLIRQLLVESVVLALIGGTGGLVLAPWLVRSILVLLPERIASYLPNLENVGLNGRVLVFSLLATVATGILFGLAPAWRASRFAIHEALKSGSLRSAGGWKQSRFHRALISMEFALSLALLIAAGLLLRSFLLLERRPLGFTPDHVLTFSISLPEASYAANRALTSFYGRLLQEVQALPGVRSAGAISNLPLGGSNSDLEIRVEHQSPPRPGRETLTQYSVVSPGYFGVMRIPLLEGRDFSERDTEHQPLVAIVSESTARHFWPGGNAVGKRIQLGGGSEPWIEIVGVVKDVRWHEFDNEVVTKLYAYVPCAQDPYRTMSVVLRTAGAPEALADSIRKVVHEIDPDQSISHLRSMNEVVTWANAPRRFNMVLMGAFAVFALFLTAAGVYGTVTHSVSSRKREFGVHLALGATPAMILRMLLGEGMRLALVGAVTGLISALLLGRTVASLLYGVSPNDPLTMAGSFILLLLVAAIASGIPGLRAMRLDPGKILREE